MTTALVLQAIAGGHRFGFDIVEVTGYATGTVYPVLRRLERAGLVRSEWERERRAARDGRPQRRYYEITAAGTRALDAALEPMRALGALTLPAAKAAK